MECFIDSEFWYSPIVQNLYLEAMLLLLYVQTNTHVNEAGFYQLTKKTIVRETKLDKDQLDASLLDLYPEVVFYPDHSLIWVRSFLFVNNRSIKFRKAAEKCLRQIPPHLVTEYIRYNAQKYNIQIPYENPYILTSSKPPEPTH